MSFFSFGGGSSPPKRPLNAKSPTIPFCTSPSQLEDVTLDHESTFSNTMGLRSLGGPMRGRSVKEIEEQLSNLKKENFNLKLRIYFLEEKMGTNFTLDKENAIKKYIELQVEYSNLQKEVQEKHELLCQAVRAMELEDEEHKKYVADKEEQLNMCQQELEDLRMQLQLQHEKENNASLQFVVGQAETLKTRYDNMQKESAAKDETIKNLQDDIEMANKRILESSCQIKEAQEDLECWKRENQMLRKEVMSENKKFREIATQLNDLKKKYAGSREDLEREHKRNERLKAISDVKTSEMEKEIEKQKAKIRDLQGKLENALVEIRKNQNLAVSKSPAQTSTTSNTDFHFSVSDAAAPAGAAQADALHVQVTPERSSAPPSPPTTPSAFGASFEEAVRAAGQQPGADKILSEFRQLRSEYEAQRQRLIKVKKEQFKACEIIKSMIDSRNKANDEIAELRRHVEQLEHELESVVTKPSSVEVATSKEEPRISSRVEVKRSLIRTLADMNMKAVDIEREKSMAESPTEDLEIAEHYKALIVELEAKIEILVATLNEKDVQMEKIRQQYEEILTTLEDKENRIASMLSELQTSRPTDDESQSEKIDVPEKHSSFYRQEMEEKDREIGRLTVELKKCTCYLQEIVNKELWDKNKEIEKLHNKHANSPESVKLKKEIIGKDEEIESLKTTMAELKVDIENSEKLRLESNEVCSMLNARLEELALFLDSLLKQKSVLGFLGLHKERRLRVLVNNSLDLSKSFAMSMIINPDQSLAQLSNITSLLNDSMFQDLTFNTSAEEDGRESLAIVPKDITLTYQSHLYKQNKNAEPNNEDLIAALREQIVNLKSELQLRDIELSKINANLCNKTSESEVDLRHKSGFKDISKLFGTPVKCNTTSTTLKYQSECQSESEGWSEPDRIVSRARIGLSQTLPNIVAVRDELSESTEEEFAFSLTHTKKSSDDTFSLTPTKKSTDNQRQMDRRVVDLQEELDKKMEQLELAESKILNAVDKEMYKELKDRLAGTEERLLNVELKKEEAENQIKILEKTIEDLNRGKEMLQEFMVVKDKDTQNVINRLEVEKGEALRISAEFENETARAKKEIEKYLVELEQTRKKMSELETDLRREYEQLAIAKLKNAEEEFIQKLKLSEEKVTQLEDQYLREYVKKSEVESKLTQVDELVEQLDELKCAVRSYEGTIQAHKDKETRISDKLSESQEKINCLRKELDQITLQYSEAVLEKTKLTNEKTALEQELSRYSLRDMELKQQMSDIRKEFDSVNQTYQQQLSALQKQKSALEVKISEMESSNAELHNKLVRLQASRVDFNASLPSYSSRSPRAVPYYRNLSNPTYSSEDTAEEVVVRPFSRHLQPVDVERQEANSSPDLGIESDHGRFSSLETPSNIIRPLKQTIELTESMSNLLDGDNNLIENSNCDGELCCRRTMEIAHENNDLKRKLLRMRRALEETTAQLSLANQRKKQVEKTICKQIHKTSQVLRKAKANLDSDSESDLLNNM